MFYLILLEWLKLRELDILELSGEGTDVWKVPRREVMPF